MDISGLRERQQGPMSVSELNSYIKNMFDSSRMLSAISVVGEISNFVCHRTGHLYFSVKDAEGQLRAVMFRSAAQGLKFKPENGMRVILRGSVSVFVRDGTYQMYVSSMQPDGVGSLYLAYEQLKERLSAEGLFDESYKRPIPRFPERIGVVTSPTGAAVRDIINVLRRRYPLAKVYIYPALVQGASAEPSLIKGIDFFDKSRLVDVVIIGRGGGSIEDLWAFNGEGLARRIFSATVPVISAVGHETDFTICDFVSDLRAPTPSAAAELATPDIRELRSGVLDYSDRCDRALLRTVERMGERLQRLTERRVIQSPDAILEPHKIRLDSLKVDAKAAFSAIASDARIRMAGLVGQVEALSPLSVLSRGYSVVSKGGELVRNKTQVAIGDSITIRLKDGRISAEVTDIPED